MKQSIIILIYLLTVNIAAQNIIDAEYFIDHDPGFSNGIPIPVTTAPDVSLDFSVDLSTVIDGLHILYFRAKDDSSRWTLAYSKPFYKQSLITLLPDIVEFEYFIDADPGFGNATAITITPGEDVTVDFVVDLATVHDGFHVLYVRGKDFDGKWSITYSKPFYKQTYQQLLTQIIQLEYFIDHDPGFGNGINVPITAGEDISHIFAADLGTLDDGFHILYVRGKDEKGTWSLNFSKPFFKESQKQLTKITEVEYYFSNVDTVTSLYPYTGFTSALDVNVSFDADISGLARSMNYYIHVYGRDSSGVASIEYTHEFFVESTNNPPSVVIPLPDIDLDEDFGTRIIADLDTIFTDPDLAFGDSLHYSLILNSGIVNANLNQSILELSSVSDSNGIAQIIVRAQDDSLASVRDTFLVSITNINDPPVITGLPDSVEFEADTSATLDIWSFVEDPDIADSLLQYLFEPTATALVALYDSATGMLTISSLANTNYSAQIYMTVTDDSGATAEDSIWVSVIGVTAIEDGWENENQLPKEFVLMQNYPNPFNPTTTIRFGLPRAARVYLELFNIMGQRVDVIIDKELPAGYQEIKVDASHLGTGIYFYRMKAEAFVQTRKFMVVK